MDEQQLSLITPPDLTRQTKAELVAYADNWVTTRAQEGWDLLEPLAAAAKMELLASAIKDKAKQAALTEVGQYGRQGVTRSGVAMILKEAGVTYDYSNDRVWCELNRTVLAALEQRKEQETFLKSIPPEGCLCVDESTGEEYRAYPPLRSASDGIQLSIK